MSKRARDGQRPLVLCLYVGGDSPNSMLARRNLGAALAHLSPDLVSLEIVDVLQDPDRALSVGVIVTPTLIKVSPPPERRVIGTLHDAQLLAASLGIDSPPVPRG